MAKKNIDPLVSGRENPCLWIDEFGIFTAQKFIGATS